MTDTGDQASGVVGVHVDFRGGTATPVSPPQPRPVGLPVVGRGSWLCSLNSPSMVSPPLRLFAVAPAGSSGRGSLVPDDPSCCFVWSCWYMSSPIFLAAA